MKALEVAFQIMQRLPVRTIHEKPKPSVAGVYYSGRKGGMRDPEEIERLIRRAQTMHAAYVDRITIAEALDLSPATVDRYVARISTAARRRNF